PSSTAAYTLSLHDALPISGERPLQRPLGPQPRVAHAGVIARGAGGQRGELVEDLRRALVRECRVPAHLAGDSHDDLRIRQRLARDRKSTRLNSVTIRSRMP